MTSVWPDVPAATSPALTVRDQLDYVVWVAEAIQPVGFHRPEEVEAWRGRLHRAYLALVDSMVSGHGDPLPPDVPPAVKPGTWPDVAAATVPGMTIRHQLAVIRSISVTTRDERQYPRTPADIASWTQRVQVVYDALDHGTSLPMPASARTEPPQPPPSSSGGGSGPGRAKGKNREKGPSKPAHARGTADRSKTAGRKTTKRDGAR